MNINFYLKEPKSKGETNIILFFRYKGYRLKYYTGIKIKPKQWSAAKQIIYSGVPNSELLNAQLRDLKKDIEEEYLKQKSKGVIPSTDYLRSFLNNRTIDETKEAKDFYGIFDEFLNNKKALIENSSLKKFNTLRKHFKRIEEHYKIKLSVNSFTKDFYLKFINYMIEVENHVNSTVKEKDLKAVNTFLNWLVLNGYIEKNEFRGIKFPYKISPADTIALTEEELNTLYNLDLSKNKRLEQIRDVFCIECYTSLRYSDIKKIQNHKIQNRVLIIYTQKTTDIVKIPLRKEAEVLLNKYFKQGLPLPVKSNQKMNAYLKELGKLAGLNNEYTILKIWGMRKEEIVKKKYELLSTHTGRRTFVTLSYQRGMKPLDIMKITGHKSFDTFTKYYRLDEIDVSEEFFNAWEELKPKYGIKEIVRNLLSLGTAPDVIAQSFGLNIEEIEKLR